jgi:peptidoglycan/LPS O-acetylase OafA/YrhL
MNAPSYRTLHPSGTTSWWPPAHRFDALDGLRGVFAIAVALLHLKVASHIFDSPLLRGSFLAVDFFFVLSGFVVTHANYELLTSAANFRSFALRRFGRLWPLHACVLAGYVVVEVMKLAAERALGVHGELAAFSGQFALAALPANVFFLNSVGLFPYVTWNAASWSIGAEFCTYILFGALAICTRRYMGAIAVAIVIAAIAWLDWVAGSIDVVWDWGTVRCCAGFFAGHLIYRLPPRARYSNGVESALELIATGLTGAFISGYASTRLSLAAPAVFAANLVVFSSGSGCISKLLKTRAVQALGRWSFSVYMIHELIFAIVRKVAVLVAGRSSVIDFVDKTVPGIGSVPAMRFFRSEWASDTTVVLLMCVVILLASRTYRWVELPGIRAAREADERLRRRREDRKDDSRGNGEQVFP